MEQRKAAHRIRHLAALRVCARLRAALVVALVALPFAAPFVHAGVTLVDQQRLIRVVEDGNHFCSPETDPWCVCMPGTPEYPFCTAIPPAGPFSLVDEAIAPDFSPFDENVSVPVASASQTSSISTTVIEGSGVIDADPIYEVDYAGPVTIGTIAGSTARSDFVVTFDVTDEPTPYAFEGASTGQAPYFGYVGIVMRLTDDTSVIAEHVCQPDPLYYPNFVCSTLSEAHRGVLAPGTYTLEVTTMTSGDPGELGGAPATFGHADYSFRLGLGPASAVPVLGWLGRFVVAGAIALGVAGGARRRRS